MDNFSYSSFTLKTDDSELNTNFGLLKTALRDTSVYYYRNAYDGISNEIGYGYDSRKDNNLYNIINFALLITDGVVV